jgi:alkanesulfonate monooxygenase SsuD/methylene tetrahydromethanopterin reductase-like flavin-dependent oxidoreductase (luciferase family)
VGELTIGLGLFTGQRPDDADSPAYDDAPRLASAAEEAGFDTFWVSEHHGWDDDYLPAPLTVLAAAAATTDRIRLGTGLALAPLYHPVALAEQAAVVDRLSRGRLVLGLGLGYVDAEFRTFGVPRTGRGRRLEELVAFLRQAWTGAPATWTDAHGGAHTATVRPVPRSGGIPIWLGGYAPPALARTGRLADGYLMGRGDPQILTETAAAIATHREPSDAGFTFGVNFITVLDDERTSGAAALRGLAQQQAAYESVQRQDDPYAGRLDVGNQGDGLALGSVERYVHALGDPPTIVATVTGLLAPLLPWARVHVVLRALFPESDVGAQVRRIERLGREVLPSLRTAWAEGQRR